MVLLVVEPSVFLMGSPADEEGRDDDEPRHRVSVTRPYYLGQYEVTQEDWTFVMGSNPSAFQDCGGQCPVESVSWSDVQEFIRRLSHLDHAPYRLPTEAEWEHAARAGTTGAYAGTDRAEAACWFNGNSDGHPHAVGSLAPNAWGFHDMLGNVREWVSDWYGDYPSDDVVDPAGPESGSQRVARGASFDHLAAECRSANRSTEVPGHRDRTLGFRLAKSWPIEEASEPRAQLTVAHHQGRSRPSRDRDSALRALRAKRDATAWLSSSTTDLRRHPGHSPADSSTRGTAGTAR